jgi:DNA-binding MarR family transcriptional regulator
MDPGEEIGAEAVRNGLVRIHQTESESNGRIIDLLTPGQVRVLLGLAKVGGAQPTSKSFLEASGIRPASSVTKAIGRLERKGLIFRDSGGYQFFRPFFRTWILSQWLAP